MPRTPILTAEDQSLYLFIRGNPSLPDHHGLYRHESGNGGNEYHARNIGFGWVKEVGVTHGLPESMGMILLLRIGKVLEEDMPAFESVLGDIVVRPYDPTFNCIVWAREALEALVQKGFIVLKEGADINSLLEEARVVSLIMRDAVMEGSRKPEAIDSQNCVL